MSDDQASVSPLRRWLMMTLALAAAMTICLVSPFVTYRNIKQFSETSDWVSHEVRRVAQAMTMQTVGT